MLGQSRKPKKTDMDYAEKNELKALIDYCSFSIPFDIEFDEIFDTILDIPKDKFELKEGTYFNGYSKVYTLGSIIVATDGLADKFGNLNTSMGHFVHMSGEGCRLLESINGDRWNYIFGYVIGFGGKCSRLDLALDDFSGYFKISKLVNYLKRDNVRSKFPTSQAIQSFKVNGGENKGTSLYFGASTSEAQVYFYEKNFEQAAKKKADHDLTELPFWNRTEIRLRKDKATKAMEEIYDNPNKKLGELISGMLRYYITFTSPSSKDSNKARRKVAKWWQKFIGDAEEVKLSVKDPERSLDTISHWLLNHVSRNFVVAMTSNPKLLDEMLSLGMEKLKPEDIDIIEMQTAEIEQYRNDLAKKREEKRRSILGITDQTKTKEKMTENSYIPKIEEKNKPAYGETGSE